MMMGRKRNFKKITSVLAAGMCLLVVSGCSDAVETQEELVTLKEQDGGQGTGQMSAEEAAVFGNVAEHVQAPEIYQTEVSGDAVSVTIDADISIPDVPGIRLKKVTARTFTQEDYDAVDRVLLGGGKLCDQDGREISAAVTYDEALSGPERMNFTAMLRWMGRATALSWIITQQQQGIELSLCLRSRMGTEIIWLFLIRCQIGIICRNIWEIYS